MSFHRAKSALLGTRFGDLRSVAETGSTNADMRTLLGSAGLSGLASPPPIVLVADHQTAGRGRLDRSWQAPPGASVLMSIGMPVDALPVERRGLLTTCLALAVVDAAVAAGVPQLRIKWPNDLVVETTAAPGGDDPGYRKVGGILAELHRIDGVGDCVVIGLGLNVNWPEVPDELAGTATSLNLLAGHDLDREELVAAILRSLDAVQLPLLEVAGAPSGLDAAYREHSATLGRRVRLELPAGELTGVATDLTDDGALVVVDDDGRHHTVTVGDVVHLRPVHDD